MRTIKQVKYSSDMLDLGELFPPIAFSVDKEFISDAPKEETKEPKSEEE